MFWSLPQGTDICLIYVQFNYFVGAVCLLVAIPCKQLNKIVEYPPLTFAPASFTSEFHHKKQPLPQHFELQFRVDNDDICFVKTFLPNNFIRLFEILKQ